jgi:hypothetical protein
MKGDRDSGEFCGAMYESIFYVEVVDGFTALGVSIDRMVDRINDCLIAALSFKLRM